MTAHVLSMTPGLHAEFGADSHSHSQPIYLSQNVPSMEQQSSVSASPNQDDSRGRRRTREAGTGEDDDGNSDQENVGGSGSSKKRRRSRKGLDKKFECPHDGCGKSYSRAEHLYRHQLNREFPTFHFLSQEISIYLTEYWATFTM